MYRSIRIHRPWLVTEASELYSYSREQSVKYSKLLLAVHRMPFCIEFAWGSLSWRAINVSPLFVFRRDFGADEMV